jgi:hypothetical protein
MRRVFPYLGLVSRTAPSTWTAPPPFFVRGGGAEAPLSPAIGALAGLTRS